MSNIAVGDHVSWTHVGGSGSTMNMSLREGTVVSIGDDGLAMVKPLSKKAKLVQVHVRRLRLHGQKSQITEFIEAVKKANGL